ncbi:MAG: hypothetical protein ACO1RX_21500 [Candidatus Sericytochromatia bacterium]
MSDLTQQRGFLALTLEMALHLAILLALLFLALGLLYPLYILVSPWLGMFWTHRPQVVAGIFPFFWGSLVFYLLGRYWSWRAQPDMWPPPYYPKLQMGLVLWGGLSTGFLSLLVTGILQAPIWGCSLGVGLGPSLALVFLPARLGLSRQRWRPLLRWGLFLGLIQGVSVWFWLGVPVEKALLVLPLGCLSLLCVGPLSRGWSGQWTAEASWNWRVLGGLALAGVVVSTGAEALQRRRLEHLRQRFAEAAVAQQADLRWSRPVLRGQARQGNAAPAYEALLLAQHLQLAGPDVPKLLAWFRSDTGRVEPDLQMLKRYTPLIARLRSATRWQEIHWAYQKRAELRPRIGGVEEYGLLMAGKTVAACRKGRCAEGLAVSWDALRLFQDFSTQGWLTPLMVAYRMERLVLSSTGAELSPRDLSHEAWRLSLRDWSALLAGEDAQFNGVLRHELLQGGLTLTGLLPTLMTEDEDESPSAWPSRWLDRLLIFPYVLAGLEGIESLMAVSAAYLEVPDHDASRWQAIRERQHKLRRQNPFLNTVMTDLNVSLLRFREHQTLLRGFAQYLALLAYASEHGEYPSTLQELVPAYLPELPLDPFGGRPFRYRRELTGPVVYSVGINGRDDGGQGFYGRHQRQRGCSGEEMVFARQVPLACR